MTETIASIVKGEPAWNLLPADVPPPVVSLLHRCLTKDPRQRLRDIGEARIALRPRAGCGAPRSRPPGRASAIPDRSIGTRVVARSAASGATGGGCPPAPRRRRFANTCLPPQPPAARGVASSRSRRMDKRSGSWPHDRKLHVWELQQLRPRELTGAGEAGLGEYAPTPFWSPDSATLAYSAAGRLWRISAQDGQPTAICNMPGAIVGGAWRTRRQHRVLDDRSASGCCGSATKAGHPRC